MFYSDFFAESNNFVFETQSILYAYTTIMSFVIRIYKKVFFWNSEADVSIQSEVLCHFKILGPTPYKLASSKVIKNCFNFLDRIRDRGVVVMINHQYENWWC